MADAVSESAQLASAEKPAQPLRRPRPEPNVPRHRFGIAYLILAAILGVAVGLFVILVADGGKDGGGAWSDWKPKETGVRKLNEISKHVESQYALADGRKLVLVLSTPLEVQSQGQPVPLRAIAVSSGLAGESADDASFYEASSAWAFNFCGTANAGKCALPGAASVSRYDLLRREAFELALYTFKYESRIDSVITYMPPAKSGATTASTALFFRRQDVSEALNAPLPRTLKPTTRALRPGQMAAQELEAVRRYTAKRVFSYTFQQLQDGTPVLVLSPLRS